MAYNLGSVNTAFDLGYTGAYTGGGVTYPYVLTSHGASDPNSVMANANFATTGTVEIRIISDFDSAKVVFDWQAISDGQLWRQDINTLNAVTVNATSDTTDIATIGWKTPDGTEGQFTTTVNITEADEVLTGSNRFWDFVRGQGGTPNSNDSARKWLNDQGMSAGTYNDRLKKYFESQGYTADDLTTMLSNYKDDNGQS